MQWQTGMRQRDLDAKLAEIERRRLEGKLSHEEAILSRQNLIHDNKLKVQEMKEEVSYIQYDNYAANSILSPNSLQTMAILFYYILSAILSFTGML